MYIGSNINGVGRQGFKQCTQLVLGETAKGIPVLKLDHDNDFEVGDSPALVIRTEQNGEWDWKPVTSARELQSFLNQAGPRERSAHLGLWSDSRSFFVFKADGEIQDKEVQTMGERWGELQAFDSETARDSKRRTCAWATHYTTVKPEDVSVRVDERASGTVAVLEEPSEVTRTKTTFVTVWGLTGAGERPASTRTLIYTPEGVIDGGRKQHVF